MTVLCFSGDGGEAGRQAGNSIYLKQYIIEWPACQAGVLLLGAPSPCTAAEHVRFCTAENVEHGFPSHVSCLGTAAP